MAGDAPAFGVNGKTNSLTYSSVLKHKGTYTSWLRTMRDFVELELVGIDTIAQKRAAYSLVNTWV